MIFSFVSKTLHVFGLRGTKYDKEVANGKFVTQRCHKKWPEMNVSNVWPTNLIQKTSILVDYLVRRQPVKVSLIYVPR